MDNTVIGAQITKFRKAAGITQEELGKAVGVSTQAVSRWENGGAPDVTLLPAIADKLGVTIDALFGREGGEALDIFQLIRSWVHTVPRKNVLEQLNRMIWTVISQLPFETETRDTLPYLESCINMKTPNSPETITCSQVEIDEGVLFGVYAEDFTYTTLCPKPKAGYDAYFPKKEQFRAFCRTLAQPGCLEVIEYLMHQMGYYFTSEAIAVGAGLELEAARLVLEQMEEGYLLQSMEIGMQSGMEKVYGIQDAPAIIPMEFLINCMTQTDRFNYLNYRVREKPLL